VFVIASQIDGNYEYLEDAEGTLLIFRSRELAKRYAEEAFTNFQCWVVHTTDRMREILKDNVRAVTQSLLNIDIEQQK